MFSAHTCETTHFQWEEWAVRPERCEAEGGCGGGGRRKEAGGGGGCRGAPTNYSQQKLHNRSEQLDFYICLWSLNVFKLLTCKKIYQWFYLNKAFSILICLFFFKSRKVSKTSFTVVYLSEGSQQTVFTCFISTLLFQDGQIAAETAA